MVYETRGLDHIKALFGDWQESMIWSCLQGVMGHLYADDQEHPKYHYDHEYIAYEISNYSKKRK